MKNKYPKRLSQISNILGGIIIFVLILSACAPRTPAPDVTEPQEPAVPTETIQADQSWNHVVESGVLRVGTAADNPPFSFLTDQYQIGGFDPELITQIGQQLGVQVEIRDFAFDGLLGALQVGQIDAAIAAITVTPERENLVDFSNIYYFGGEGILARSDFELDSINGLDELSNYKIGVQRLTIYEGWVRGALVDTGKLPASQLFIYGKPESALADLRDGLLDVVIIDLQPAALALTGGGLKLVGENLFPQRMAIAVNDGSAELLIRINQALVELQNTGFVNQLVSKYLGLDPNAINRPVEPSPEPTPSPTRTPQPEPEEPVCVDAMEYVADLNYDDFNLTQFDDFLPGESFQKGWRIRNNGTCPWTTAYSLRYVYGTTDYSQMSGQPTALGVTVAPGGVYDIYVNLVAPIAPGRHIGYWQMFNAEGKAFGPSIWVGIETVAPGEPEPTPLPQPTATPLPPVVEPTAPPPTPTPDPISLIIDKEWNLKAFEDNVALIPGTEIVLELAGDKQVTGSSGCNNFSGTYLIDGDRIAFTGLRTGMIFCQDPASVMAQEGQFIEVLQLVTHWVYRDNVLEFWRNNKAVLIFTLAKPR